MKGTNQETFQELHNDAQEYCLSSGPLNSKARTFPAALLNGLELVAAALAAMALTSSMLRFFIVSSPLSVMGSSMEIRVNVHNMPEDEQLRYVLSPAHDPQEVLEEGVLREGLQDLRFQGLDGNSPYILYYYLGGELADDYSFVTGPENQLEPVPAPSGSLTPSPEPTPSLEPTPSATPTPTPSPRLPHPHAYPHPHTGAYCASVCAACAGST